MKKIEEINFEKIRLIEFSFPEKINEVIKAINNLKCVEEEKPIFELLAKYECLIISENEEGLLVACNIGGKVELKRLIYPKGEDLMRAEKQ